MIELVVALLFIYFLWPTKTKPAKRNGFTIHNSRGDYESHLDFLEEHGFITEEDRESRRKALQHYKDNPHLYKVTTLDKLLDEWKKEQIK